MKDLGKIVLVNVFLIFTYDVILRQITHDVAGYYLVILFWQIILNIVTSFVLFIMKKGPWARSFLLSSLLVLIIGLGVCVVTVPTRF
ncbi:MAG TPA: hypothetical protein VN922_06975 [Bacteroidia bacterium]|nr:hypothetical protein [Bacteroidia bacterium]